ncbi:unnamed protein product [Notodromas monacha]|uniref:N-alpha-acetyltransferase 20 n=1 Tax=Notodromas monacha TaxID=399045 RepID=A0A7R9BRV9_9CRUS|nr:unnamed protein product [Notodromas monacha]CAG0920195.1 unnamed protein product [Notodromas monacha]
MSKAEGTGERWHAHVTALSVGPDHRRFGLARKLMQNMEEISEKKNTYFVDLFVRISNKVAIAMYKALGYIVYRTVLEYYSGNPDEDAYAYTFGISFYLQYLAHWSEFFQVARSPSGELEGYIMSKAEGTGERWHAHVTALSVGPDHRRFGLARKLMQNMEEISEKKNTYFVDLFVRISNKVAIAMYKALGYIVYRTVLEYYSGNPDEDAYDMRKAMSRDVFRSSVVPLLHPIRPEDLD